MSDKTPLIEKWLSCQTLKYYGSIDVSFLDYGHYITPCAQILWYFRNFSFYTLSLCYLIHSCYPLKSRHPALSHEPNISACASHMYIKSTNPKFMSLPSIQIWTSSSVSSQLSKPEKGVILFSKNLSGCFCTSDGLSSSVTPKSFINTSLPFLFSLWLVLLKFLPSFAWTSVQKSLIDWLPDFYYSKSSLYIALSYNVFLNKKQNGPIHQSKPNMTMSLPHLLFFKGSLLLVRQSSDSSASHIVTLLCFLVLCSSRTPCDLAIPSLLPFPKHIMLSSSDAQCFPLPGIPFTTCQLRIPCPQFLHLYNRVITMLTSEGRPED